LYDDNEKVNICPVKTKKVADDNSRDNISSLEDEKSQQFPILFKVSIEIYTKCSFDIWIDLESRVTICFLNSSQEMLLEDVELSYL
jgi:hypothetical protein